MEKPKEILLWSIAFPGFGQLLCEKYVKGILLVSLEFLVNVKGNINLVIMYSFQGEIQQAIGHADYQWIMFYPCLYFFAIWDAYKSAGGGNKPYAGLPFVFSAYFMTVGVIYSTEWLGPVWLPILSVAPGLLVGFLLQKYIRKKADR